MLASALKKPLIPVNHLSGHLYSPVGTIQDLGLPIQAVYPQVALIVSGGHTTLILMKDPYHYKVLGQTVDDAAGEAFDKVAKLLKLPYPGGPEVSKLAEKGQAAIPFPRPMMNSKDYNFSFAGLKTAVLYYLRDHPQTATSLRLQADICASFQQAAADVLITKTLRAAKEFKAKSISLSGGVSANKQLRENLKTASTGADLKFFVPQPGLSTDNAEMIGIAAAFTLMRNPKLPKPSSVQADSNLTL
jgi:N6-L-threonylcarbamoyladenine synthase